VYAKAGIWQETISILAQLRHDRPSDRNINAAWKELLESVNLTEIANAPLVECCRADNDPTRMKDRRYRMKSKIVSYFIL
jgi:hypothetical protein